MTRRPQVPASRRRRPPSAVGRRLARALRRARGDRRVAIVLVLYVLLTLGMAWQLVRVQVVSADEYRRLGWRQTQSEVELPARRGSLYDRNGDALAMSLTASTVYADPRQLAKDGVALGPLAARLAELLDREPEAVLQDLGESSSFTYLARQVPREVGDRVTEADLPGVGVLDEPTRVYPAGDLAAPVVGVAGVDHTGLSGLEAEHDGILRGQPGSLAVERTEGGVEISAAPRQVRPPVPGTDLVLTLDRDLQAAAEAALAGAVERSRAEAGSAVVLDAGTGEVLALASVPADGADGADGDAARSRALTDAYEPGSVNKVITLAGAIEDGLVSPSSVLQVPDGHEVGGKVFRDAHPVPGGSLTVDQVMAQSSNVGTIRIAERLGADGLHDYLEAFGYGAPTGLGFPGESAGLLADPSDWSGTSLPTIAIGQGVSATLLQVADVFATIASGGEWVQPSLVRGTIDEDGALEPAPAGERRRVVSQETADAIARMLVGVVSDERGTGSAAAVPGYHVGGKTGTARKPRVDARGYEPGAYVATFAGFAPAEDPQVVVAVAIDEPQESPYGGVIAAPVFSELMGFALAHLRVPPTVDPRDADLPTGGPEAIDEQDAREGIDPAPAVG